MPQEARATADDGTPSQSLPSHHTHNNEKITLSTTHSKKSGIWSSKRLLGPVDKERGDHALLAHSLVTGMVDAAAFANWNVFVGMQTGNTVILGLSTATLPANPHAWTTTLVSLSSFLLGSLATFKATTLISPNGIAQNRLYLSAIYLVQSLLLLLSAALITTNQVPHNPPGLATPAHTASVIENIKIVALLPPLAFQSGMQIATSRLLGFNELPINVLTSTYADLMGDAKLFALHNVKRNRRGAAVVLLLGGAIAAGWLMRSSAGTAGVLWVAGGVKIGVALGTLVLHPEAVGVV